jgi:hypothetical protein
MADQLPSWADGQAKTMILEFVPLVTEPGASFVPAQYRVAAFDNDGTLWCEKPMYPQAGFLLRRWKEMARAHPGMARKQPWKAVVEGTARHPVLGVAYTRLGYRPISELIDMLTAINSRSISAQRVAGTPTAGRDPYPYSPYKRDVTGSNPVVPHQASQLDGFFETLIVDPVSTAGKTGACSRTGESALGGQRIQVLSCSCRATVISQNQGSATLTLPLPSDAWAVAATWARAVCSFASSRHH